MPPEPVTPPRSYLQRGSHARAGRGATAATAGGPVTSPAPPAPLAAGAPPPAPAGVRGSPPRPSKDARRPRSSPAPALPCPPAPGRGLQGRPQCSGPGGAGVVRDAPRAAPSTPCWGFQPCSGGGRGVLHPVRTQSMASLYEPGRRHFPVPGPARPGPLRSGLGRSGAGRCGGCSRREMGCGGCTSRLCTVWPSTRRWTPRPACSTA